MWQYCERKLVLMIDCRRTNMDWVTRVGRYIHHMTPLKTAIIWLITKAPGLKSILKLPLTTSKPPLFFLCLTFLLLWHFAWFLILNLNISVPEKITVNFPLSYLCYIHCSISSFFTLSEITPFLNQNNTQELKTIFSVIVQCKIQKFKHLTDPM